MYRYLDRPLDALHPQDRMLVISMRQWVLASGAGRSPCATAAPAFHHEGVDPALPDFNMAMAVLHTEALVTISFSPLSAREVGDDEARLLALFAADDDATRRRLICQFVHPHAVVTLATAIERVAAVMRAIDPREPVSRDPKH